MSLNSQLDVLSKRYKTAKSDESLSDKEIAHIFADIKQDVMKVRSNSGLDDELFLCLMESYGLE